MIEEYNDKNRIPQVRGGQGRDDESVEGDGWYALYFIVAMVIVLALICSFGGC